MTTASVTIIGANAAGLSTAFSLRSLDYPGDIRIIDGDSLACCERPLLSKSALLQALDYDASLIMDIDFLASCTVFMGESVLEIDPVANRVVTDRRSIEDCGALVLATGAEAIMPAIANDGSLPIQALRSWNDALALRARLMPESHLLIVGGGVIGCEVAAAAAALGADVTLVERDKRLMNRAFDDRVAEAAKIALQQCGVRVLLETELTAVEQGKGLLSDGAALQPHAVLMGVGVRPRVALAQAAGIHCDNGICVDVTGLTDLPNVYAAGDVARGPFDWQGDCVRFETQTAAMAQGRSVAAAIMGQPQPGWLPYAWSDQGAHHYAQVGWRPEGAESVERDVILDAPASTDANAGISTDNNSKLIFYIDNNRIAGATAINAGQEMAAVRRMVNGPALPVATLSDASMTLRELVNRQRKLAQP